LWSWSCLSGFLLGDLRLLVEDLCQTLLSLGVFGLYYWQSLRWLRLDPPVVLLWWWSLFDRLRLLAPLLHLRNRRAFPRNRLGRLGGPLISFHIVLFLWLLLNFLNLRLAPAVFLIPGAALRLASLALPLFDFSWNRRANFRRIAPVWQLLLLLLLRLVIVSF